MIYCPPCLNAPWPLAPCSFPARGQLALQTHLTSWGENYSFLRKMYRALWNVWEQTGYQRRGHITWDVMLLWVLPFSCQAPARTCQGVIGSALSTHDECMYNLSDRCCWERKRGRKNEPGERDRYKTLHIKEKSHLWNTVSRGRRLSEPQTMSSSSSTIDS